MSTGSITFNAAPAIPSGLVTGAANGLSENTATQNVELGQLYNAAGDPAMMLTKREIPFKTSAGIRTFDFTCDASNDALRLLPQGAYQTYSEVNPNGFGGGGLDCIINILDPLTSQAFPGVTTNLGTLDSYQQMTASGLHFQPLDKHYYIVDIKPGFGIAGCNIEINGTGTCAWSVNGDAMFGQLPSGTGNTGFGFLGSKFIPTAKVEIASGTVAVNGAPFKYNAGVLAQAVVENGAKNFDGTNESLAAGGVTYIMAKTLTATAVLDFGLTAAGTSTDLTIAVAGAAGGDVVSVGVPLASIVANGVYSAFVSAAGTVTVRFSNNSLAAAIDPASGTFRVSVLKY